MDKAEWTGWEASGRMGVGLGLQVGRTTISIKSSISGMKRVSV